MRRAPADRHLLSCYWGGKKGPSGVALLSHRVVGGKDRDDIINLAASFELIHSATLIHDDINDLGEIRRGREAAYKKYGVQKALIAGDFLFVRSFRLGGSWDVRVVKMVADAATAIAESEIVQSAHEFDRSVTRATCEKIIEGKTAKIIQAAAMVGAYLGKGSEDQMQKLGAFGLNLGMAFQIVDDILDVDGEESQLGKSKGIDFIDGKPTLPLMFAFKDPQFGSKLAKTFVKREKTKSEVREALRLVRKTDAVARSTGLPRNTRPRQSATSKGSRTRFTRRAYPNWLIWSFPAGSDRKEELLHGGT